MLLIAGDGQSATVGSTLVVDPRVRIVSSSGAGISGVSVVFTVLSGGGSVFPSVVVTDVNGFATTDYTLGGTAGTNTMRASTLATLPGTPKTVTFTETGTVGSANKLGFTVQPSNTATAGVALTTQPAIAVMDAFNNVVTSNNTASVTIAAYSDSGCSIPVGSGFSVTTNPVTASSGVASFSGVTHTVSGTIYIGATSPGLTPTCSNAINVSAGSATQLAFTTQPTNTLATATINPAVQVVAQDTYGNTATGFTGNITLAIGTNPGSGTLSGTATVAATAGVSTFSNLSIDKVGTGYTLNATSAGLTSTTSNTFNITVGAATQLAFTTQPSNTVATSSISPAVVITALDAGGNTVTAFTGNITIAIGTNPSTGILSGTTTIAATAGVSTFSNLSIDKVGTGYTLTAASTGLTGATSNTFNITAGSATQLSFTTQPSNTVATSSISPAVVVTALDAGGNTATGFTGNITIAIGTNPGSGTLSGTATVAATAGVSTFSNLSIDKIGVGYTLTAASAGLTGATSNTFDITVGAATQLSFTTQPSNTVAGSSITPAVVVTALDAGGNTATGFTGNITIAIGTNPSTGILSGTTTIAATAGVSTFSNLSIDKTGTGYTLTAASAGLTGATSNTFNITAGSATQLSFTTQPSNTVATSSISPAVVVTAQDALGNTATGFTGNITIAIGTNPGSGTLSGTATVAATAGVSTFSNLSIDKTGVGYTLTAASAGLTGATSNTFDITVGAATQLSFTTQPSNTVATSSISPAVVVTALDAGGNTATGFTGNITIAIGTNPGSGTLSGTATVAATAGVSTFSNLSIDKVGTGYTLTAASAGLTGATSNTFNITAGSATQLSFTTQPSNTGATLSISPAVVVTALDAGGNTATGFTGNITVAIGTNPSAGVLSGTTTVAATAGVSTFSNLSIDKTGTGYTLTASSAGLTGATSNTFNITAGAATQLSFTTQPSNTVSTSSISPAVVVTALDASGNTATGFTGNITIAIGTNPGSGTLSGTLTVAATAGVSTFSNLSIDKVGTGYTLTAASAGLTGATSNTFNITVGAATQLAFTTQPSNTVATSSISPAVVITARDAGGNTATGFTGNITIAIGTNPGSGTLSGTTTVAATAGVSTFSNLSIDKVGTGYTLTAASAGLTGATSNTFNITAGSATQLAFTTQPSNTVATSSISPAVVVTARDAGGNTATGFTGNITIAIGTNPGSGTLSGTLTVAATAGVSTFSNLSIDKVGTGYTLTAASAGLTGATSNTFNITAGSATQLSFSVQPSNTVATSSISPAIQVSALDAGGNLVTGYSGNITLAIGTNPGSGTLSGTLTIGALSGVATFTNISINKVGTGYTLTASGAGVGTGATSNTFNITVGTATQLSFSVQPSNTVAGSSISPAVQVTALDAGGNTATGFTGNITLAIGTNPGSGTLSGTTTVAATAGVASFSNLSIDKTGTGYTLSATATGPTGATSNAFNITAGTATQLVFTVQPSNTVAAASISPAVQVTARDALGNTATGFTSNITIAIGTNPGSGTLSGTVTVAATAGVASFSNLSINKTGTGYTLTASATGPTGATSNTFNITAGTATQLSFTVQPSTTVAGSSISPAVQVTALDAGGNTATGFTGNITVAIGTNPGSGTLSGTLTVAATSGVASFSNLSINKVGTGYTLTASATGPTGATSNTFNITPGTATKLSFTVQPTTTATATAISPAVQVTALDANDNVATGFTSNITIAIGTNPSGGTLSGTTTVAATAGVSSFSTLSINLSGTGYTLATSASGLTGATSNAFNIINLTSNLSVSIELTDMGIESNGSLTDFDWTRTSLDTNDYDGTLTYTFEIIATNSNGSSQTVSLVNSTPSSVASISVPASTTTITRFSTTFTPTSGANNYRIRLPAVTAGNLKVYTARIIVRQVGATKTKLYIPLTSGNVSTTSGSTTQPLCTESANTIAQCSTPALFNIWRKDSTAYGGLDATSPWTFEAVLSTSNSGRPAVARLRQAGTTTEVTAANISTTSTTPALVSATFADNATNFTDATDFEVQWGRQGGPGGINTYIHKAALWVKLTNMTKGEIYRRISRSYTTASTLTNNYHRVAMDTAHFTNGASYLEIVGSRASGTLTAHITDEGTSDTSTGGSTIGGSSNTFGATKARTRGGSMTMATGGTLERYINVITCTSCATPAVTNVSIVTTFAN